jgi:hypothetical protein
MNLELFKLRFVGVTRFVLHVLQVLSIGLTQHNLCCIRKFCNKASTKFGLKIWPSPYLVKVCMFVNFLIEHLGPPSCDRY